MPASIPSMPSKAAPFKTGPTSAAPGCAKGSVADNMNYFLQMDFAFFGRPTFTDVWVEWTDLPILGTVRVGQWKQPFSLEVVSSFRYTTFMERSSLFQAFTPFRHIGVGFYNHSRRPDTRPGPHRTFGTGQDQFGGSLSTAGGNGFVGPPHASAVVRRRVGRPQLPAPGRRLLSSTHRREHASPSARFPKSSSARIAHDGAGTSGFAVPGVLRRHAVLRQHRPAPQRRSCAHASGLEAAVGLWPAVGSGRSDGGRRRSSDAPTRPLDGGYVQVGWFLTGEHRPYDRVAGAIDRVKPFEDFFRVRTERRSESRPGSLGSRPALFAHRPRTTATSPAA